MGTVSRGSGGESSSFLRGDSDPLLLRLRFTTSVSLKSRLMVTNVLCLEFFNLNFNFGNGRDAWTFIKCMGGTAT